MPSLRPTALLLALALAGAVPAQQATILRDIQAGSTSSLPARFVDLFGVTYFTAADPVQGHSLWRTDGTLNGTVSVKDFYPGSGGGVQPRELTPLGNRIVCFADDGIHGAELWISDGTTAGTVMIKDINPGNQGRPVYMDPPVNLTPFKDRIFFSARDGIHGRELWSTDGTAAGTRMVKDIYRGGNYQDSLPSYLTVVGDTLFFFGFESVHGWELWKTDGTTAGTVLVKDVWPGSEPQLITHNKYPFQTGVLGDKLIFAAPNPKYGYELWVSDGTGAGTVLLKDINPGTADSWFASNYTAAGPYLFFSARNAKHGMELWRTDGTTAGTILLKDINPGAADSNPGFMAPFGNKVVFGADDGVRGHELWISDGTPAGTKLLKEIRPGSGSSVKYARFFKHGSRYAWFPADDGRIGGELWRTDGTAAGTVLVQDLDPGYKGGYPEFIVLSGGRLIFRARTAAAGQEPWVYHPGATAQTRGRAYRYGGDAPSLTATDPVAGVGFTVSGRALNPGRPLFLLVGLPAPPTAIIPGMDFYLDTRGPISLLRQFIPVPTAAWSQAFVLPKDPGLLGAAIGIQGFQLTAGTLTGFDATAGLVLTVGR